MFQWTYTPPQSAYYFGVDEVYSFHMGLMQRMSAAQDEYNPEDFVNGVTLDAEIAHNFSVS